MKPVEPVLAGEDIQSELSYRIINKNSGLCLEVKNGSTEPGTNIQQWEKNVGPHNEWLIHAEKNGWFSLRLKSNESMAVTVEGNDGENGRNVVLEKYTGADGQLFSFEKNGLYYDIVSKCSKGKAALDVYEWSTKMGGNVNQWEYNGYDCQLWRLELVCPTVNDGDYYIYHVFDWMTPGESLPEPSSKPEKWRITRLDDGAYSIRDSRGKAITVQDPDDLEGRTDIILADYTGDDSQKFRIVCNKYGYYSFISVSSGLKGCIDRSVISSDDRGLYYRLYGVSSNNMIGNFSLMPVPQKKPVIGDVNGDGEFSIADLTALSRYLLGNGRLNDPAAAEVCGDDAVDAFDLVKMRKMLIEK